jgi:ABC-type branched-subunit amino acid transport system substrate-binding protein
MPFSGAAIVVLLVCAASAALSGCLGNSDADEPQRIRGDVATVYSSAPQHGVSKQAAEEVLAGEERALAARHGRVGRLRIRLRQLPATDERDHPWDPALVAENAQRAADDPTAIAYIGELDYGATAVSLPITNKAGLLQVSPGDGLTSLTERPPGRPRAGPERYYPADRRSFVRIGPTDLTEAEAIVARLRTIGATTFGLVVDREIYGRELAAELVARARPEGLRPVASEEYRGQVDDIPDIARGLAEGRPDAVVLLGVAGRGTIPMLVSIDDQLPGVPVFASSGMLAIPQLALPPGPTRIEAVGAAIDPERMGYVAMSLALDAIAEGGRDRRRVAAAGLRLGSRLETGDVALYTPDGEGRFRRSQARFSPR